MRGANLTHSRLPHRLLTQSLSDSFNTLADMYSNIADALGAADKVFELLERKPAADAPPAPLSTEDDDDAPCRGDVSFEDVAFTSVWKSNFGRHMSPPVTTAARWRLTLLTG